MRSALLASVLLVGAAPAHNPARPFQAWSVHATPHFDIYFQAPQRGRVDAVASEAERAYARLSNLLRYELAAKMDVILLAEDRDLPRSRAQAYALVRASGASDRDHLLLSMETFDQRASAVVAHELTHQFLFELFPDGHRAAPWVAEALPDHHGGAWEASALARIREDVSRGRVPAVEELAASDRHWGRAVFDFVAAEYGARGVRAYLTALSDNPTSNANAIRVAFDQTPPDFNVAFRTFVTARFGMR